jgi:hypothetical protein
VSSVVSYQLAGLISAALLQSGFCGIAMTISRRFWPLVLLALILAVSSVFALQAFFPMRVFVLVFTFAVVVAGNILFVRQFSFDRKLLSLAGWVAVIAVGLDSLYAAFPDYRYDQWSYHLLVGKQIVRAGPLALPVIYDHIFFSGNYEYLTTIPRYIWDHDLFAHCFSNGFSFLTFAACLFGLVQLFVGEYRIDRGLTILLTGAVIFAIPDHEVLVSSKPDPLLICYALAVFYLVFSERVPEKPRFFLLAFFICAPASFKLTWIHFLFAAGAALLVLVLTRKLPLNLAVFRQLAGGGLAAFLVALPFLIRNFIFFGNPVHPVQAALFRSSYWTAGFDSYWQEVSGKALTAADYVAMLPRLPLAWGKVNVWLLVIILGVAVVGWRNLRRNAPERSREFVVWGVTLVGFILLWPMFYRTDIYPRFVYPVLAVAVSAVLMLSGKAQLNSRQALVLLLPILFNTSLEVKLHRISRAYAEPDSFFSGDRLPYRHWGIDQVLNQHRAQMFPGAGYREHRVLSDSHIGYFLDTERIDFTSPDYTFHRQESAAESGNDCIWHLVRKYDVAYLRAVFDPFDSWPAELADLAKAAVPVDGNEGVRFLPENVISDHISQCAVSSEK